MRFFPMMPNALTLGVKAIDRLLADNDLETAIAKAIRLEFEHPCYMPVLQRLLAVMAELDDMDALLMASEGLAASHPEDDGIHDAARRGRRASHKAGLSYLGDNEAILNVFRAFYASVGLAASKAVTPGQALSGPIFLPNDLANPVLGIRVVEANEEADRGKHIFATSTHHYAPVALAPVGRFDEARKLWQTALSLESDLDIVEQNLDDLELGEEQRNGPWAFSISDWIPQAPFDAITSKMDAYLQKHPGRQVDRRIGDDVVRPFPCLETVALTVLDHGDSYGCMFIPTLSPCSNSTMVQSAVRDFALRQRGSDALRQMAARDAGKNGLLPDATIRLWVKANWREVALQRA